MDWTTKYSALSLRLQTAALLLFLSISSLSCQVTLTLPNLAQTEAHAAQDATPTPTYTPTPGPTPGTSSAQGAEEMDAASKIFAVPGGNMPRGPRKQPPTRLVIPSIGLDTKVIELGTLYNSKGEVVWETAPFAAGHHMGTANPGERGNVVISGHISSPHEGAVFNKLPEINLGDGIIVSTSDRDYLYKVVDKKVVLPTQLDVMSPTPDETLTLMTCVPDGIYSHRLVITAKRL